MVLIDLSKAYDCLPYDLLVANLHAYGCSLSSLKMIYSYLTSRKQRVKIKSTYSSWLDIKSGVPPGSVLGPLLSMYSSMISSMQKKLLRCAILLMIMRFIHYLIVWKQ